MSGFHKVVVQRHRKCLLTGDHGCYVPRKFRVPLGTMEDGDGKGGMDSVGKKNKSDKTW